MLFELVFIPSYCTEDVRVCLFVRTLFSFLVSYFCNLLAFSSTFLVATKISVSTSRVLLFRVCSIFCVLLKELEASVRLGVLFDVIFLYFYVKKRVLRREFSGLREILFVSAGLASRFIEWRAITV